MSRAFGWLLRAAGVMALLVVLVMLALAASIYFGAWHLDPTTVISIDGDDLHLASFNAGHALIAAGAIVLAMLIVFTVVPLALFGAFLAVACALGVAALAVGGVALLLFSPLILFGLLIWWLVRRSRRTTIPA